MSGNETPVARLGDSASLGQAQLLDIDTDTLVTMPGYGGLCSLVEVLDEVFVVDLDHVLGTASRCCLGGGR